MAGGGGGGMGWGWGGNDRKPNAVLVKKDQQFTKGLIKMSKR